MQDRSELKRAGREEMEGISFNEDSGLALTGKACSLCGSRGGLSRCEAEPGAPSCPRCGTALASPIAEETFKDYRQWLEQENPALLRRLTMQRKRRAQVRHGARLLTILAGLMAVAFLAYYLY